MLRFTGCVIHLNAHSQMLSRSRSLINLKRTFNYFSPDFISIDGWFLDHMPTVAEWYQWNGGFLLIITPEQCRNNNTQQWSLSYAFKCQIKYTSSSSRCLYRITFIYIYISSGSLNTHFGHRTFVLLVYVHLTWQQKIVPVKIRWSLRWIRFEPLQAC